MNTSLNQGLNNPGRCDEPIHPGTTHHLEPLGRFEAPLASKRSLWKRISNCKTNFCKQIPVNFKFSKLLHLTNETSRTTPMLRLRTNVLENICGSIAFQSLLTDGWQMYVDICRGESVLRTATWTPALQKWSKGTGYSRCCFYSCTQCCTVFS